MTACTPPYENMKQNSGCSLFNKCCFCIPLRTGCFILGYLSLLLNLLIALFFGASLAIMAVLTSGFRYNHLRQTQTDDLEDDAVDRAKFHMTIMVVLLVGCLNVAWVLMNAFLLVGLHKKRPGPIRIHVAVATVRLLLSVLGLVTVNTTRTTAFCWVEIGLSAYFIMLYYAYAMQLEREQKSEDASPTQDIIADIVFSYPKNIDKEKLTEKDNIKIITI